MNKEHKTSAERETGEYHVIYEGKPTIAQWVESGDMFYFLMFGCDGIQYYDDDFDKINENRIQQPSEAHQNVLNEALEALDGAMEVVREWHCYLLENDIEPTRQRNLQTLIDKHDSILTHRPNDKEKEVLKYNIQQITERLHLVSDQLRQTAPSQIEINLIETIKLNVDNIQELFRIRKP